MKPMSQQNKEDLEEFYLFADELYHHWKKTLPRYTERELVEIFSPEPEMIRMKLDDWKAEQIAKTKTVKNFLKEIYGLEVDDLSKWFGELMVKTFLMPDLEKCTRHISRLKRILDLFNLQKIMGNNNQESIERARRYPIYEITKFRLLLRGCGNKFSSLCPFHEEKHASFYIYPETNTFHCFGCQENGDIIKLTMHLYGASFKEAVKMLQ